MPGNMLGKMSMLGITPMKSTGHHLQHNFLHKVNVSEPRAESRLSLPRFFHDLLHSALSSFPSFRETTWWVWNCLLSVSHQMGCTFCGRQGICKLFHEYYDLSTKESEFCTTNSSKHCKCKCFKIIRTRSYISGNLTRTLPPVFFFFSSRRSKRGKQKIHCKYMLQVSLLLPYTQHMSRQF